MRQRRMLIVSMVCGVFCAACVGLFMAGVRGEADAARAETLARYGGEQVDACVALRDIAAGERLDGGMVALRSWVSDLLPEGAVLNQADVLGRTVTSPIVKGEVVTSKRFEQSADSLDVPSGKVALSVPAKTVQAVGGALRSGMLVDVYASGDTTVNMLAQNVLVLDTSTSGQSGLMGSSDITWVTLALDQDLVQEFVSASAKTTLHFTLPGNSVTSSRSSEVSSGAASVAASSAEQKSARAERKER